MCDMTEGNGIAQYIQDCTPILLKVPNEPFRTKAAGSAARVTRHMAQILGQALITLHEFDPPPVFSTILETRPLPLYSFLGCTLLFRIPPFPLRSRIISQFHRRAKISSEEAAHPVSLNGELSTLRFPAQRCGSHAQSGVNIRDQRQWRIQRIRWKFIGER